MSGISANKTNLKKTQSCKLRVRVFNFGFSSAMKASLKFRDDHQRPLIRAKLPINILNFPFQSGIVAGNSKELTLHITTFFDSGPSLKLAYKPYDVSNPFALVVKTGTGKYGSPIDGKMVMSAEFNLCAGGTGNPSFFVHFKPRFGDFGIRKKQSSSVLVGNECNKVVGNLMIGENFESSGMKKIKTLQDELLKGVEIGAVTSLPVLNLANVKFGWGVRFPTEMKEIVDVRVGLVVNKPLPTISFRSFPFLVMKKISIEQVRCPMGKDISPVNSVKMPNGAGERDVSMMCAGVRLQLEALRDENGMLRKAVEDLRSEISNGKGKMNALVGEIKHREVAKGGANKPMDCKADGRSSNLGKEDGNEHIEGFSLSKCM